MKTYTFKIKIINYNSENPDEHPSIVSCIHCPLEVFYDSFKASKELLEFCKEVNANDDTKRLYVTICDFLTNEGVFVEKDCDFCDIWALIESNNLKELLTHKDCYGVL